MRKLGNERLLVGIRRLTSSSAERSATPLRVGWRDKLGLSLRLCRVLLMALRHRRLAELVLRPD